MNTATDKLNREFEEGYGFFDQIRNEFTFDEQKAERYLAALESIEIAPDGVDVNLVKLIWSLPLLLEWQAARAERNDFIELSKKIEAVANKTFNILEAKIGLP